MTATDWAASLRADSRELRVGTVDIHLPDELSADFSIVADLADLFAVDYQSEAVELFRAALSRKHPEPDSLQSARTSKRSSTSRVQIDAEAENTLLSSRSAAEIVACAEVINARSAHGTPLSDDDRDALETALRAHRRPNRQEWTVGSLFSIPLRAGRYGLGQVIGTVAGLSPVCALFDSLRTETALPEAVPVRVISLQNTDGQLLADHTFTVGSRVELRADPSEAPKGRYTSDGNLRATAEAYFGLRPWNVLADRDYYSRLLLPGVDTPTGALLLSDRERSRYRRRVFGLSR